MESNGWRMDISNNMLPWEKTWYDKCCSDKTFYGFKRGFAVGTIMATFKGYGTAILDFGNCGMIGCTKVYLDNQLKAIAGPNIRSKVISFSYRPGTTLWLGEHGAGIIKLNYLNVKCEGILLCF